MPLVLMARAALRGCQQNSDLLVSREGKAPFQVFTPVPSSSNPIVDNSHTQGVGCGDVPPRAVRGGGRHPVSGERRLLCLLHMASQQQLRSSYFYVFWFQIRARLTVANIFLGNFCSPTKCNLLTMGQPLGILQRILKAC